MELSEIQLGATEFSSVAFGNIGLSGEGGSGVQDILAKMPAELRSALVCWYSPNLQGMTNKQLYDAMLIGEYPILRDLSGNGYDMELHGFDGTSSSGVDGDGNLVFDGVNDFAEYSNNVTIENLSIITKSGAITQRNGIVSSGDYNNSLVSMHVFYGGDAKNYYTSNGTCVTLDARESASFLGGVRVITPTKVILPDGKMFTKEAGSINTAKWLTLGAWHRNVGTTMAAYYNVIIDSVVIFSKGLSDSEIDWVKTNMLVSQEPKRFTINLWHYNNGEPILLGTRRINNGSEIGELPSYDISATECTNEWYYDLTLSEDALVYDDDYVESDLNLYCSTMTK